MNYLPSIRERQSLGFSVSEFELSMAEQFGEEVARRFIEHFGGTEIYLPKAAGEAHPIALAVGVEVLRGVIETYGAGAIHVPLGVKSAYGIAAIRLRQLITEGGRSESEIARLARCDIRTVRRARRSLREKGINVPPYEPSFNEETP